LRNYLQIVQCMIMETIPGIEMIFYNKLTKIIILNKKNMMNVIILLYKIINIVLLYIKILKTEN